MKYIALSHDGSRLRFEAVDDAAAIALTSRWPSRPATLARLEPSAHADKLRAITIAEGGETLPHRFVRAPIGLVPADPSSTAVDGHAAVQES